MNRIKIAGIFGIIFLTLTVISVTTAAAGKDEIVVGVISADSQIVDANGTAYEVADNEKAVEILKFVGSKVEVTGRVIEADGTPIITIMTYRVLEK